MFWTHKAIADFLFSLFNQNLVGQVTSCIYSKCKETLSVCVCSSECGGAVHCLIMFLLAATLGELHAWLWCWPPPLSSSGNVCVWVEWFFDNLVTDGKTNIADGGTSHGSQSMTCMFAGKQPQHSDSHSEWKGDNCNVWKKLGAPRAMAEDCSGPWWHAQFAWWGTFLGLTAKTCHSNRHPRRGVCEQRPAHPVPWPCYLSCFDWAIIVCFPARFRVAAIIGLLAATSPNFALVSGMDDVGPTTVAEPATSLAWEMATVVSISSGIQLKRSTPRSLPWLIRTPASQSARLICWRWNGKLLLHPENVLLQSMQTVAALRWEQCRMQCNISRKRDSG